VNFTGPNFSPNLKVTVGGVEAKIISVAPGTLVVEMPKTAGGTVVVTTGDASTGGGSIESLAVILVEQIYSILMDFDGNGAADKSWKYWAGDTDQTGGFSPAQTVPAPKSGGYGKLAATKGATKNGYAMIGHDPKAATWDLTNVTLNGASLRMDVNNNGFPETRVAFEFTTPAARFTYATTIDGAAGWRNLEIPLNQFTPSKAGEIMDPKKLGELKFFLQGYSATKFMDFNVDNVRLSASKN
jgi:hypothetical protein